MSGEPPAKKSRTSPKSLLPVEYELPVEHELPLPPELRERVIKEVLRKKDDVEGKKRHYLNPKLSPLWKFYNRAIQTTSNETKFDDFVTLLNSPWLNTWLENRIEMPVPVNPIGSDDDGFLTQPDLLELMKKTVSGGFDPALKPQNIMTNTKRLLLGLLQCKNVKAEFTNLYVYEIHFFRDTFEGGVVFTLSIDYQWEPSVISLDIRDHRSKLRRLGGLSFTSKPIWDRVEKLTDTILPLIDELGVDPDNEEEDAAATEAYHKENTKNPMRKNITLMKNIIEELFADENLDGVVVDHQQPTDWGPDKPAKFCIALAHFLLFVGLPYTIQEKIYTIQKQEQVAYFASFVDRGVVMQSPVYTT
jgi:hypothetical protein